MEEKDLVKVKEFFELIGKKDRKLHILLESYVSIRNLELALDMSHGYRFDLGDSEREITDSIGNCIARIFFEGKSYFKNLE